MEDTGHTGKGIQPIKNKSALATGNRRHQMVNEMEPTGSDAKKNVFFAPCFFVNFFFLIDVFI